MALVGVKLETSNRELKTMSCAKEANTGSQHIISMYFKLLQRRWHN